MDATDVGLDYGRNDPVRGDRYSNLSTAERAGASFAGGVGHAVTAGRSSRAYARAEAAANQARRNQQLSQAFATIGAGDYNPAASAGDNYTNLTRNQWYNYMTTFVPIENKLIAYATDPTIVTDAMNNASANVNESFDSQQASTGRRLRGLGVSLTPEEQKASNRSYGLARSLADVGAQNVARDVTRQRQQSVLGNPTPGVPSIQ